MGHIPLKKTAGILLVLVSLILAGLEMPDLHEHSTQEKECHFVQASVLQQSVTECRTNTGRTRSGRTVTCAFLSPSLPVYRLCAALSLCLSCSRIVIGCFQRLLKILQRSDGKKWSILFVS